MIDISSAIPGSTLLASSMPLSLAIMSGEPPALATRY
jgi:hypothetical protein